MQKTQVFIRDDQKKELSRLARITGRKQSTLIREGIDLYLEKAKVQSTWKENMMKLAGCLTEEEGESMQETVRQLRSGWNNRIQSI